MTGTRLDRIVVGAGLTGLAAAAHAQRAGERLLVVERLPEPGGQARTLRREGFACEPGPFALPAEAWRHHDERLGPAPRPEPLRQEARSGWVFDGTGLRATPVHGDPCSGATGIEELAVAYRRRLGPALRLGRAATGLAPLFAGAADDGEAVAGWTVTLGGEVAATLEATNVELHVPLDEACRLCAPLDPSLAAAALGLRREGTAFVFLGTWQDAAAAAALRGYGVLVAAPDPATARELLFCSNAFPRRAAAGKALVRVELAAAPGRGDDAALAEHAEAELRRITGWTGSVLFLHVHRASQLVRDGHFAECAVRLRDLARRAPGLTIARD